MTMRMRLGAAPLLVLTLMLGACTTWPEHGTGGFAERREIIEPRIEALAQRFEGQRRRGAERMAAGLTDEARIAFIRAQRNHAAGICDDVEQDIARLATLLDAIERQL